MKVLAANVVPNGSFENWGAGWSLDWNVANVKEEAANVHSGTMAVNFWSATDATFSVSRQVTGVAPGAYTLSVWNHGAPEVTGVSLSAVTSAGSWSVPMPQTGWALWANPTVDDVVVGADGVVTVAVGGSVPANGWGWFDDVVLTPSTGTVAPDTSALDAALAAAGAVHRAWYTDASLAALDHAVEVGHVVLAGSFATADDVAAATALVNGAIAGLEVSAPAAPTVTATLAATTVNTVTAASVQVTVRAGASAAPTGQVTVHYGRAVRRGDAHGGGRGSGHRAAARPGRRHLRRLGGLRRRRGCRARDRLCRHADGGQARVEGHRARAQGHRHDEHHRCRRRDGRLGAGGNGSYGDGQGHLRHRDQGGRR